MRRMIITCTALLLTAGLVYCCFQYSKDSADPYPANVPLVRVWASDQEPSVWAWLRKAAKQYEKESGTRVYLRGVSEDGVREADGPFPPDLLISNQEGTRIAIRGLAIFFRDDRAQAVTPHPTGLLFFPSSPTPGPEPSAAPTPDIARFSTVLTPIRLKGAVPGGVQSQHALQDFAAGKGDAAILTVEEAQQLPFPVSAYPLAKGEGGLPIYGSAATGGGEAFLAFLCAKSTQEALADNGLFSPYYSLYRGTDSLRGMIEEALQGGY